MWSDPGKHFVGAKPALKELYEYLDRLDNTKLENEATKNRTKWKWKTSPVESTHRNWSCQRCCFRTGKRALIDIRGGGMFIWEEFQTYLFMTANLANERPIDGRTQSREDCIE